MIRDSNKDPTSNPNALLAKILIDQVALPEKFWSSKLNYTYTNSAKC